jgi:small subunit ribosomal protein S21
VLAYERARLRHLKAVISANFFLENPPVKTKRKELYSLEVEVQQADTLEDALRRFRKKCQRAGLFSELKRRSHYTKPSEERILAQRKAERREERRLKKQRRRSRFW